MPPANRDALRARYPDVLERPAAARLATPVMLLLEIGVFTFGLVDLEFSPSRLVAGLHELGWITLMMLLPTPAPRFRSI